MDFSQSLQSKMQYDSLLFCDFIEILWQKTTPKQQTKRVSYSRGINKIIQKPKPIIVKNYKRGKSHREYFVNKILTHRTLDNGIVEFYVNWLGYDDSYNTWEPYKSFVKSDGSITVQLSKYLENM